MCHHLFLSHISTTYDFFAHLFHTSKLIVITPCTSNRTHLNVHSISFSHFAWTNEAKLPHSKEYSITWRISNTIQLRNVNKTNLGHLYNGPHQPCVKDFKNWQFCKMFNVSHISIIYDFFAQFLMLFTLQTLQFQTPSHHVQLTKQTSKSVLFRSVVLHESMKQKSPIPKTTH